MPANLGYITALLFNQNNCAAEASTVTTKLEVEVGTDLSVMMGYDKDKCMGHLTAGGSVANIEAVWAARNVKFFPLGLHEALRKEDKFTDVRGYKVRVELKPMQLCHIIAFTPDCVVRDCVVFLGGGGWWTIYISTDLRDLSHLNFSKRLKLDLQSEQHFQSQL